MSFSDYYFCENKENPFPESVVKNKVYHGTDLSFDEFDRKFLGSSRGRTPSNMAGFFFTDNIDVAKSFGKNLKVVYLDLKNPKIVDARNKDYSEFKHKLNDYLEKIDRSKYDGIIIKNYVDSMEDNPRSSTQYVVFDTKQIRIINEDKSSDKKILTLYHGSNSPIQKFDRNFSAQGVFWFSEDKDKILKGESGAVSTAYLITAKVKVSKIAGWEEYKKYALAQIKQYGFDSIKLDDDWIIFDSKNIKVINIEKTR